jgi:TPR repeat protein
MRFFLPLLILAVALVAPGRAEDADASFRAGLAAFNEGSYARAFAAWGPIAAAGEARAQEGIGYMYYSGRGVPRDSRKAAEFFYRAADQGEPTAQLFLALMFDRANGVPKSPPLAMMWLELAMAGGLAEAYDLRENIMQSMTEAERTEAWRLIARWRETHATKDGGK